MRNNNSGCERTNFVHIFINNILYKSVDPEERGACISTFPAMLATRPRVTCKSQKKRS